MLVTSIHMQILVREQHKNIFFYRCAVHFDICTVHSPTNSLFKLKTH